MSDKLLEGIAHTGRDRPEPLLRPGNTNCGGCGMSIALNMLSIAAARIPLQITIPASCSIVAAGAYPLSNFGAPVIATTFASAAAVATGLAHVARLNGEQTRVVCWAGDGGTYDIGMATISGAAERNEDILFICYDNEIYGNTGGQRSSATPLGATTATTPFGKKVNKKDIVPIIAAHGVPYAATLSLAHPEDTVRKLRYALQATGFRFLHILSPCPTGWKSEPAEGVQLIRMAVRSGLYAVYEVFDGRRHVINVEPEFSSQDLAAYLSHQGRFRKNAVDVDQIMTEVKGQWEHLRLLAGQEA